MRVYNIKVNGKKYKVEVMGISEVTPTVVETKSVAVAAPLKQEAAPAAAAVVAPSGNGTNVVAPMQGTIIDIKVNVGASVRAGETVAVLEAMKLENEIKTQVSGKVTSIAVSKGQSVNSKDVILTIE